MPDIDSLGIQIGAESQKAEKALDSLVEKLDVLSGSLGKVSSTNFAGFTKGIQDIASSMQSLKDIKLPDYTRLGKGIQKLATIDNSQIAKAGQALMTLGRGLQFVDKIKISDNAEQIAKLAKAIAQLGYRSADQAVENIPKLAKGMFDLMNTLSKAPKVSQNIIDMTNALAKLSRTGASSGKAANSLSGALNTYSSSATHATRKSFSLASAIGKVYATYWMIFRAFNAIGDSIDLSSDLTEVQNVVNKTFGDFAERVEELSETSIIDFGMSELTVKQVSSRFQAMGTAMGFTQEKMADMSIELTKLTADMASFYNVEQKDVAQDLESIFTGETRPLRTYGLDLTEATLKEWAFKNGLDSNIKSMTQAEKAMLRYQYVLAKTESVRGDFLKTQDTWANQTRILTQNLQQLGSILGGISINALKPFVKYINMALRGIIDFAETVSNALGKIFGWKFETDGGITQDYEDASDYASDLATGTGNAADNAQKLKKTLSLLPFDQLNQLSAQPQNTGSSSSGNGGSDENIGSINALGGKWVETESLLEEYKSDIDDLFELGQYISRTLEGAMASIDWNKIYSKASNWGTNLATYLNGRINPGVFYQTGRTLAGAINTAFSFLYSFGDTFEWGEFGLSIATGINSFIETWDAGLTADTFNKFANGFLDTMIVAIDEVEWEDLGNKVAEFISRIEWGTILRKIGALIWAAISGGVKAMSVLFTSGPIENKIAAVLLGMKFVGIGYSIGVTFWKKIKETLLAKLLTSAFGKSIGKGVASAATGNIATELTTVAGSATFKTSLIGALKPAFSYAALMLGLVLGAQSLQSWTEKLRGGNGILSDFGDIIDRLSVNLLPELSDKFFELKEELEDGDLTLEEFATEIAKFAVEHNIPLETLRQNFENIKFEIDATKDEAEFMNTVLDKTSEIAKQMGVDIENSSLQATGGYDLLVDVIKRLQSNASIAGDELFVFNDILDRSNQSGLGIKETWELMRAQLEAMGKDMTLVDQAVADILNPALESASTSLENVGTSATEMKDTVVGETTEVKKVISESMAEVETGTGTAVANIEDNVTEAMGIIGTDTTDTFSNVASESDTNWSESQKSVIDALNTMKSSTTSSMIGIFRTVESYTGSIYNITTNNWDALRLKVGSIIDGMNGDIELKLNSISDYFATIKTKINTTFSGMYSIGQNAASNLARGISSVHIPMPHISVDAFTNKNENGYSYRMNSNVNWYRNGGFIAGEIWGMNENGNPEMVGRLQGGSHQTAVANNAIIAEAIEGAVERAMVRAMMNNSANTSSQSPIFDITVKTENDEVLARAVTRGQKKIDYRMNATPQFG